MEADGFCGMCEELEYGIRKNYFTSYARITSQSQENVMGNPLNNKRH